MLKTPHLSLPSGRLQGSAAVDEAAVSMGSWSCGPILIQHPACGLCSVDGPDGVDLSVGQDAMLVDSLDSEVALLVDSQ